jgi:hypothetical protein
MAGDRPALVGLLLYLLVAVAPTLIFWAVLRVVPAVRTAFDGRRRAARPPPRPSLECQVADLRRLRRRVRARDRPTRVRRVALQAAYDEVLIEVCGQVGVDAPLARAVGRERAFARLQTEAALEAAGIVIDPPTGGAAAA